MTAKSTVGSLEDDGCKGGVSLKVKRVRQVKAGFLLSRE
jgi:hypothetical protein